jgi:nitroreductase
MQFEDVIRGRRSIRAYRPEAVPQEVISAVLDEARWAPSWRNTQAWQVWVVTGAALERFKQAFTAAVAAEQPPAPDLAATAEWPAACSVRTAALMAERAATLKAAGESADPAAAMARMADLFGAPCLLVFGFDECLAEAYASYDVASLVQNVGLAAHDKGLGTCIVATFVRYPDLLRGQLPGAAGTRFVVAVTLGYPQPGEAINAFDRSRAPLEEFVTWVS